VQILCNIVAGEPEELSGEDRNLQGKMLSKKNYLKVFKKWSLFCCHIVKAYMKRIAPFRKNDLKILHLINTIFVKVVLFIICFK
jgi:hypothetical protein